VRGLTTAASLWVVAAVGLAAGTGSYFVAAVGTALAMLSLWPVHRLVAKLELSGGRVVRVRLGLKKLDSFAAVSRVLLSNRVEILSVQSEKSKGGHFMDLELRLAGWGARHKVLSEAGQLAGVESRRMTAAEEPDARSVSRPNPPMPRVSRAGRPELYPRPRSVLRI